MTYKETVLAIRGYENKQEREWQRIRVVAYQVYASTPTKDSKKSINAYLPLSSDRLKRKPKEEMDKVRKFFIEKIMKQNEAKRPN
jgi:hypothetical protein